MINVYMLLLVASKIYSFKTVDPTFLKNLKMMDGMKQKRILHLTATNFLIVKL